MNGNAVSHGKISQTVIFLLSPATLTEKTSVCFSVSFTLGQTTSG
jgi:hypothetical protein